jgi:hypothetical protein
MSPTTKQPRIASCSFCLKPDTDVAKLVAGPGVFICNECVALCTEVIEASMAGEAPPTPPVPPTPPTAPDAAAAPVAPWEMDMPLDQVLSTITKIDAAGTQTDRNLRLFVAKARDLGGTWTQIGQALGIARQSAWERFSGEE